jgi:hypothetical protein
MNPHCPYFLQSQAIDQPAGGRRQAAGLTVIDTCYRHGFYSRGSASSNFYHDFQYFF